MSANQHDLKKVSVKDVIFCLPFIVYGPFMCEGDDSVYGGVQIGKKGNKKDVQVGWAIRFRGLVRHRQQPPRG